MNGYLKPILSLMAACLVAAPALAELPMEQPLPDASSPSHLVGGKHHSRRRSSAAAAASVAATASAPAPADTTTRDIPVLFVPGVIENGALKTPARSPAANGCPVSLKSFGGGRYLADGLFTDFTLPAEKSLMVQIKATARSRKKNAATARQILARMKAGTIDAGYYQAYITVDDAGGVKVDLIKRLFLLPDAGSTPATAAAPAAPLGVVRRVKVNPADMVNPEGEKLLRSPVKPVAQPAETTVPPEDVAGNLTAKNDSVAYESPDGIGPKWASLPKLAPDFHAMPEPVAIGRDAIATPNLTAEQRVNAREFGDGALTAYARALSGSGDLQGATEKVTAAAQATSLFINPGALTKALLDLSAAVRWEGRPGHEETAAAERNERVAEALATANRQLSTAGIYLEVAVPVTGKARAESYFLRGKQSVQVLGSKNAYDLRQISGPVGWYGFFLSKFDVTSELREPAKAFGDALSTYLANQVKTGDLVSRPNGLASTVQAAWGIETLVRREYGRHIPTGEEFAQMWLDGMLLHEGFHSFFRKNGGAEKAVRMTNEQTALAVAEQAAFLYQLSKMDPRMVHVALCVIIDRCYRLDANDPVALGARRMFDNFQTESGIQILDARGNVRMEGLRDLAALDAERIQQMAAESLVREIIRIYLPGTY